MKNIYLILLTCSIIASTLCSCASGQRGGSNNADESFKKMAHKLARVDKKLKKKTVAVYGFEMIGRKDPRLTKYATEKLTHYLVDTNKLMLIERSRINKILKEQKLGKTGIIDASTAARIGKILSVEAVVIGSINIHKDQVEVIGRVIQSETALIMQSANVKFRTAAFAKTSMGGQSDSNKSSSDSSSTSDSNKDTNKDVDSNDESDTKIDLARTRYKRYQRINIRYSGLPGNNQDWITLVRANKSDSQYGQWFYTRGKTKGRYSFRPVRPGDYEIRVYYNWPSGGYVVQKRIKITVE